MQVLTGLSLHLEEIQIEFTIIGVNGKKAAP